MDNTRERRTYIRVELPVECTILFAGKKLPGECLNISATGMSIAVKTSVSLNIGDEVEIQLDDSDDDLPPLDANAKVVRIIDKENRKYGIQFISRKGKEN